jgi:hypothetical protein
MPLFRPRGFRFRRMHIQDGYRKLDHLLSLQNPGNFVLFSKPGASDIPPVPLHRLSAYCEGNSSCSMSFSLWSRRLYGSSSSSPLVPQMILSRLFWSASHSGRLESSKLACRNVGNVTATSLRVSLISSASSNISSTRMGSRVFMTTARPRTLNSFAISPFLFRKPTPMPTYVLSSLSHFSTDEGPGGRRSPYTQVNPPPSSRRWAQGVGLLGAASVLFGKTKYLLAALKLTKLASLGSMVLSIGAYSMIFGWPYAVGMVGLIFCHECGHLAVMLQRGIPFSPMVFIPFSTSHFPSPIVQKPFLVSHSPFPLCSGCRHFYERPTT